MATVVTRTCRAVFWSVVILIHLMRTHHQENVRRYVSRYKQCIIIEMLDEVTVQK
jgi:hypothetical protein